MIVSLEDGDEDGEDEEGDEADGDKDEALDVKEEFDAGCCADGVLLDDDDKMLE